MVLSSTHPLLIALVNPPFNDVYDKEMVSKAESLLIKALNLAGLNAGSTREIISSMETALNRYSIISLSLFRLVSKSSLPIHHL